MYISYSTISDAHLIIAQVTTNRCFESICNGSHDSSMRYQGIHYVATSTYAPVLDDKPAAYALRGPGFILPLNTIHDDRINYSQRPALHN